MHALAIDTATEMCSVALSYDGEIICREKLAPNQHSSLVLGMVDEILSEAGVGLSQLDLIVSDVGPGSFTGIRIGIGVAQGLAFGAGLPMLGVDSLSSLAQGASNKGETRILAAIDARMSQVYWALFESENGQIAVKNTLHLSEPSRCAEIMPSIQLASIVGVGSGWDSHAEALKAQCKQVETKAGRFPVAVDGLAIAMAMPKENWVEAGDLMPVYLRDDVAKVSKKSLI